MTDVMGATTVSGGSASTDDERAELARKAAAYDKLQAEQAAANTAEKPQFFMVKTANPRANGRILFRSVSQKRAMAWIEQHIPRGGEFYLEAPDGSTMSYEQERTGEKGADTDQWQPYDPSTYVAPELNQAAAGSGGDAWSDVAG
jgi:hypothetical protein